MAEPMVLISYHVFIPLLALFSEISGCRETAQADTIIGISVPFLFSVEYSLPSISFTCSNIHISFMGLFYSCFFFLPIHLL